jgi:RNA polymerase sigma factor (sigma-70 family)
MANRAALVRFVRARMRGEGDPEDLLQDLWLKLSAADVGPVAEPLAYLYRMAENLMLDRRRSAIRRNRREAEWTTGQVDSSLGLAIDTQPSVERVLLAREALRRVNALLDALPDRTAQTFRAVRIEGVPQKQIAHDLGISLSAVEKHLQRAYRVIFDARQILDADIDPSERH